MARTILTIGALVIGVAATVHGATGKKVDPTKMTCAEFVALTEEAQPRVVAWLDGYSSGAKAKPEAVPVVVKREIAHIVEECTETPKQSLWDKIRGKLPGGKKTVANPAKGEKPGERGLPNTGYRPGRKTAKRRKKNGGGPGPRP